MEASIHRLMGQPERVLDALRLAAAEAPEDPDLAVEVARAEQELGLVEEAQQRLLQLLRQTPDHLAARLALAERHRAAGRLGWAFADLHHALLRHPDHLGLQLQILRLLVEMGAGTAETLRRHIERTFGPRPELVVARLVLLREEGRWHEALALAQAATRPDPQNPTRPCMPGCGGSAPSSNFRSAPPRASRHARPWRR